MLFPLVAWMASTAALGADSSCLHTATPAGGIAFVDVAIVPMDRDRMIAHRTVLVRGCRIEVIGHRDSVPVPVEYTRIQGGDDAFLLPGLVDSHTHLRYDGDLTLYLARGVTTVRNMIGDSSHVQWKRAVRAGRFGPRIITAAPMPWAAGPWPATLANGFVDSAAAAGFDFIKVQDPTPGPVYAALVAAARRRGLRVAGHIPVEVGLEGVLLARQQTIEHAEQFVYRWFGEDYDRTRIPDLARRIKASGVAVTPTLEVIHSWIAVSDDRASLFARPELVTLHPETLAFWNTQERTSSFDNRLIAAFQDDIVRELARTGVPLLAGTDAYLIGLAGGSGLLRELGALRAAGLSNFEVLQAATATPAAVFGYAAGQVAPGRLADLILIDGDPLRDLGALGHLRGVMQDGTWHEQSELAARLDTLARRYAPGNRFVSLALGGQTGQAISEHRRLRERSDSTRLDSGTLSYVASILRQRGRLDDALTVYGLVLEEDPSRASAHEGIARAQLAAGRIDQARAALGRALALDPERRSARELLASLSPRQ